MGDITRRFPGNTRIATSGKKIIAILEEYMSSMRAAKVGH